MSTDIPSSDDGICPHCGAKMLIHRHVLNVRMIEALRILAERGGGRANLNTLGLTRNLWDNFQKMRYWELVSKAHDENGRREGGVWQITERGYRFLSGRVWIWKRCETFRGDRTQYLRDERCSMRTLNMERWRHRGDYADDARNA